MTGSGILQQAIDVKKSSKKAATHFALCNGNKIRYLIDLHGGKRRLSGNIATYSRKLGLLMKMINFLPFGVLEVGKLGYFAEARLHPEIERQKETTRTASWNVIVGTYDEKQKLVLQCFNKSGEAVFVKIGNQITAPEMETEIHFLSEGRLYQNFDLPVLLGSSMMSEINSFNIQITKEFHGEKVEPVLTDDIIKIYKELSTEKKEIKGVVYERSHGDFTPWNLKKRNGRYTLFDWEHTGFRSIGYDLMHYVMTIEIALNGRSLLYAYESGIKKIQRYIPDFKVERDVIIAEYKETIKELKY
ncbi:hypothetical protein [Frisingicoccus sp.]|uniref:hypothetical protein n=1 Tax=Frisingicoccus sp. TaxID=1918627 RepID=UPI003AB85AD1